MAKMKKVRVDDEFSEYHGMHGWIEDNILACALTEIKFVNSEEKLVHIQKHKLIDGWE